MRWLVGVIIGLVVASGVVGYLWQKSSQPVNSPRSAETLSSGRYVEYSPAAFAAAAGSRRVLYFFAPWCSTCRPADAEFTARADQIPADVILFRVNYDAEAALKRRYDITYQHTFVQVDENGGEVTKWSGGGIADLLANLQ